MQIFKCRIKSRFPISVALIGDLISARYIPRSQKHTHTHAHSTTRANKLCKNASNPDIGAQLTRNAKSRRPQQKSVGAGQTHNTPRTEHNRACLAAHTSRACKTYMQILHCVQNIFHQSRESSEDLRDCIRNRCRRRKLSRAAQAKLHSQPLKTAPD